ncbi:hypothetical protein ACQPXM_24050 [Kribbella sp. CA-253562]|uniref:hypothetical protein n=1 Tax=Kribbella sp. CA-253562 TaxID=3239942 RepID=UPI003D8FADA8
MSRSVTRDRWSDGGDPALARRAAWMWVFIALAAWAMVGLIRLTWWVAQVNDYQDNYRGFEAGDPFPWVVVIVFCVAGVACLPVALVQASRARYLTRQHSPRGH